MKARFSVLPDERGVLLGVSDGLFETGVVYEAIEMLDEIIIRKVGKYALPAKGSHPCENSTNSEIIYSGLHLLTEKEHNAYNKMVEEKYKINEYGIK